jgi:hypothetical protein
LRRIEVLVGKVIKEKKAMKVLMMIGLAERHETDHHLEKLYLLKN